LIDISLLFQLSKCLLYLGRYSSIKVFKIKKKIVENIKRLLIFGRKICVFVFYLLSLFDGLEEWIFVGGTYNEVKESSPVKASGAISVIWLLLTSLCTSNASLSKKYGAKVQ
jgi:hypothetical protein